MEAANEIQDIISLKNGNQVRVKKCMVCKCHRVNVRLLPCKHHFHARCVYPWPVSKCPICKQGVVTVEACDIETFYHNGEAYYPPQNLGGINMQRSGRWSPEETSYARYLMEGFNIGMLPLGDKTNLGGFLCLMLLCNSARLSSKLRTGKRVFVARKDSALGLGDFEQYILLQKKLSETEELFLSFVARTGEVEEAATLSHNIQYQWMRQFMQHAWATQQPLSSSSHLLPGGGTISGPGLGDEDHHHRIHPSNNEDDDHSLADMGNLYGDIQSMACPVTVSGSDINCQSRQQQQQQSDSSQRMPSVHNNSYSSSRAYIASIDGSSSSSNMNFNSIGRMTTTDDNAMIRNNGNHNERQLLPEAQKYGSGSCSGNNSTVTRGGYRCEDLLTDDCFREIMVFARAVSHEVDGSPNTSLRLGMRAVREVLGLFPTVCSIAASRQSGEVFFASAALVVGVGTRLERVSDLGLQFQEADALISALLDPRLDASSYMSSHTGSSKACSAFVHNIPGLRFRGRYIVHDCTVRVCFCGDLSVAVISSDPPFSYNQTTESRNAAASVAVFASSSGSSTHPPFGSHGRGTTTQTVDMMSNGSIATVYGNSNNSSSSSYDHIRSRTGTGTGTGHTLPNDVVRPWIQETSSQQQHQQQRGGISTEYHERLASSSSSLSSGTVTATGMNSNNGIVSRKRGIVLSYGGSDTMLFSSLENIPTTNSVWSSSTNDNIQNQYRERATRPRVEDDYDELSSLVDFSDVSDLGGRDVEEEVMTPSHGDSFHSEQTNNRFIPPPIVASKSADGPPTSVCSNNNISDAYNLISGRDNSYSTLDNSSATDPLHNDNDNSKSQWLDDTVLDDVIECDDTAGTVISKFGFEEDNSLDDVVSYGGGSGLVSTPSIQDSFSHILGRFLRQVPFQLADVWVPVALSPDCNVLVLGGSACLDNGLGRWGSYSRNFYFKPLVGIPGRVLSLSRPEAQADVSELTRQLFPRVDGARSFGLRASLGIPVRAADGGRMVVVFYSKDSFTPTPELVTFTEQLLSKWNFKANITLLGDTPNSPQYHRKNPPLKNYVGIMEAHVHCINFIMEVL
eukprot:gene8760-18119_t